MSSAVNRGRHGYPESYLHRPPKRPIARRAASGSSGSQSNRSDAVSTLPGAPYKLALYCSWSKSPIVSTGFGNATRDHDAKCPEFCRMLHDEQRTHSLSFMLMNSQLGVETQLASQTERLGELNARKRFELLVWQQSAPRTKWKPTSESVGISSSPCLVCGVTENHFPLFFIESVQIQVATTLQLCDACTVSGSRRTPMYHRHERRTRCSTSQLGVD